MKKQNPQILVLGSNGMVGRAVFKYFLQLFPETIGTVRKINKQNQILFDFKDKKSLDRIFKETKFEYVINCIGILKNNNTKDYKLNFFLPSYLESLSRKYNFKIVNISTDDVYSPLSKKVNEKSKTKPDNLYGISKLKGEINSGNVLNIRTSFLGFDPIDKKGLIEFLTMNENKEINGFINQTWSGCTTLQFAKLCKYFVENDNFSKIRNKNGIVNFAPIGVFTKFELLNELSKSLDLSIKINEFESEDKISRYLNSLYFDKGFLQRYTTEISKAIEELIKFENI